MFFLLPLQVEDAAVDRVPWVSIGIAALCAVVFLGTWVIPSESRTVEEDFTVFTTYYDEHPYLELPEAFGSRLLSDRSREKMETLHEQALKKPVPGGEPQRLKEQAYVNELADTIIAEIDANPMRRYALVPARGLAQPGWITHLFLHFGWMHLLGNLLFFYIAGPLLEDIWGRTFFAGFYLLGGVIAGAAQTLIERGSPVAIAGASGAIAACMGAFSYRYATRKVRMGYLFFALVRLFRGTFLLPAWLWGASWFAIEVFSFERGSAHSGVAVMAHICGFLFGAAVAFTVGISGFERRTLRPAVERGIVFRDDDPEVRAREAIQSGDHAAAAAEYRRLLMARPGDREALLGLISAELGMGQQKRAMDRLDKLLQELLQQQQAQEAWTAVDRVSQHLEARRFAPRTARMLIEAADYAPAGLFLAQANQLKEAAAAAPVASVPVPAAAAPAPVVSPAAGTARITPCKLAVLGTDSLELETLAGQRRTISLARIAGIGAAMVAAPDGSKNLVITDLVFRFAGPSGPATAARISGPNLQLSIHFPGAAPRDSYGQLIKRFLAMPGVVALPSKQALENGRYPLFPNEAALDAAFYRGS